MSKKLNRIFHTWEKWECYPAGFYENKFGDLSKKEGQEIYKEFLNSKKLFSFALKRVISEWKMSCEHYLTNEKMNRIAWLGQASVCIALGIPSIYKGGFFLLNKNEQSRANLLALKYLNIWLKNNGYPETDLNGAGINSHADIY